MKPFSQKKVLTLNKIDCNMLEEDVTLGHCQQTDAESIVIRVGQDSFFFLEHKVSLHKSEFYSI
jgi:hypothetical protein